MSTRFESGHTYNLKELFTNGENCKIVIPDLQRDYCWGDTGTLVLDFVENIKRHCDEQSGELMMGLLYGYYEEARTYLQLCDGQQRITTLFLLMGLINRKCGGKPFREILISDFELNEDDGEPNLLYGIRDSSLYFLSDLVCKFFVLAEDKEKKEADAVSDFIRNLDWWFLSYDNDPTIKSILNALDTIDRILPANEGELILLGEYIATKLQFVFLDMGNRQRGEETFVIINTTGEPLTATENLKPLIVTKNATALWEKNSQQWEDIDNWFWRNRDKVTQETSDEGMAEFLRWTAGSCATQLEDELYYALLTEDEYSFPFDKIGMENIWEMYETLKYINEETSLIESCPLLSIPQGGKYDLRDYFVILPALSYFRKFKNTPDIKAGTEKVYRFFQNLRRYTEISVKNNNIRLALDAINRLCSPDLCSLLEVKESISKVYILTREEEVKLKVIQSHSDIREELESQFERMASHEVLSGRIGCLISWSGGVDNFRFDNFKEYAEKFEVVFRRCSSDVVSDITALALATAHLSGFPISMGSNLSFGSCPSEWNTIIYGDRDRADNIEALGGFLQKVNVTDAEGDEVQIINEWISDEANQRNVLYPLIKGFSVPETEFEKKNIRWGKRIKIFDASGLIRVYWKVYKNYMDFYLLGENVLPCWDNSGQWMDVRDYGANCLIMDHREYDISMDLLFDSVKEDNYCLRIFERNDRRKTFAGLTTITQGFGKGDDGRKISVKMPWAQLIELVRQKKEEIRGLLENKDGNGE